MKRREDCPTVIVVHTDDNSREHVTSGKPCWCKPTIKRVLPAKRFERTR